MVVLGNPPYANFGRMNRNPWIQSLLNDYKRGLKEKKLNLDDDFIKFIRFAQWRIEKTGHGIVGFITSNTYLDGITHRRMRESLMQAFDEIYILDLHGSSKKKERAPDGGKDENVFDITVGVSILLAVRLAETVPLLGGRAPVRVFHAELWGERKGKYDWFWQNDASQTPWTDLAPAEPHFFFVPKDFDAGSEYETGWKLGDVFSRFQNGVKTDRDDLFIDFDRNELSERMRRFYSNDGLSEQFRATYRVENSSSYDLLARRQRTRFEDANVQAFFYRPFDTRWLYYSPDLTSRPASDIMRHMLAGGNRSIVTTRKTEEEFGVLCTCLLAGHKSVAAYDINTIFPLYFYPATDELDALVARRPNINPEFLKALAEKMGLSHAGPHGLPQGVTPEDIFHYAYAVFHSPTYRTRYAEFLKIDFPRLPLTDNQDLFFCLAALGGELVALHLMESPKLNDLITEFPVKGTDAVEKVQYNDKDGRVWINPTQYFGGVPAEIWNFYIGGYQVCEKWLKDRKGRKLTYEDTRYYQRIVVALNETIRDMKEIDDVIRQHGDWPNAFSGNNA